MRIYAYTSKRVYAQRDKSPPWAQSNQDRIKKAISATAPVLQCSVPLAVTALTSVYLPMKKAYFAMLSHKVNVFAAKFILEKNPSAIRIHKKKSPECCVPMG